MRQQQIILSMVLFAYLLVDARVPLTLAKYIDTVGGNAVVWIVALSLFSCCELPVAMLGLVVAYVLIERSKRSHFMPSEAVRSERMASYNVRPFSLEEEVIASVPAFVDGSGPFASHASYKPVMA